MAQNISIPGGNGHPLVFNVTGSSLVNEFSAIAATLHDAFVAGTLTINNLSDGTTTTASAHAQAVHVSAASDGKVLNLITGAGNSSSTPNQYTLTTGGEYTSIATGTSTTVTGSTGGDTVFGGAAYTYHAMGGSNEVLFASGDNTYVGSSASNDTVSAGSGHDTITTGAGFTTVFGGTGDALINLNDAAGSSDNVYLGSGGHSTVNASGAADVIATGTAGNTIYGGSVAGGLFVSFASNTGVGIGDNVLAAGAATTTVFDSVGGNTIFGGTGPLFFVGESAASAIADTIVGGAGGTVVYGSTNDNLIMSNDSAGGVLFAIAGGGNETLNSANATGSVVFYGLVDTVNAATENTSVIGGSGTNFFNTGSGTEAILGGTGNNIFTLNEGGAGTNITIFDFAAGNDSIAFGTAADSVSLNTASVSGGNLTITLADSTTVTFVGITSLSGHTI